jgi:hypothetical protein
MALKLKIENVTVDTSTVTTSIDLLDNSKTTQTYIMSLLDISFRKKMYQPTEVLANIQCVAANKNTYAPVSKNVIEGLFKFKKAGLYETPASGDDLIVGEDYYVHEVEIIYYQTYMKIVLKIYSPDKLLTLLETSRTFVGQRLKTEILASEMGNYKLPYDDKKSVAYNADNMKVLAYTKEDKKLEHIFPYLVQYNESFYDMLARTTNRWGEFMYYENGKLNIGYSEDGEAKDVTTDETYEFESLSYFQADNQIISGDKYDQPAIYDKTIAFTPYKKSPNFVHTELYAPGDYMDKVICNHIGSFFKTEKNVQTFIYDTLFKDTYDYGKKKIRVDAVNEAYNSNYFPENAESKKPDQYGSYDFSTSEEPDNALAYNEFTELNSPYNVKKYLGILKKEQAAGKDAVRINYDTTYPALKLGQIIKVYGKDYIVVQVDCKATYGQHIDGDVLVLTNDTPDYSFEVIALARNAVTEIVKENDEEKEMLTDKNFYPTVIPSGHARYAEPQTATVQNADDPNGTGRVRVTFAWQGDDDTASPWIEFAANTSASKGYQGRHYQGDKVFVGFLDGNVERPYVMGAQTKGPGKTMNADMPDGNDILCSTPQGHQLRMRDGAAGLWELMTNAVSPAYGALCDYFPEVFDFNPLEDMKESTRFSGGFELTDYYGMYKVAGSTQDREVTVSSPWGDVNISAFTGITVSAPNGDVTIKGKNVSIQAGNNLELISGKNINHKYYTPKDTKGGVAAQLLLDMVAEVNKKLAESFLSLVDLSIFRAMVDIVFRPIEGSLTVKSNRFLKLEAGKNECDYPDYAYNPSMKKKMLDAEAKNTIMDAVGGASSKFNFLGDLTNLSLDNGMIAMIGAVKPVSNALIEKFKKIYGRCVDAKNAFDAQVEELKKVTNDKQIGCSTYTQLKEEFWKEADKFEKWTDESKLGFLDNAKVISKEEIMSDYNNLLKICPPEASVAHGGSSRWPAAAFTMKMIVLKRISVRQKLMDQANELRKAIFDLQHLGFDKKEVNKCFSPAYWRTMPKDFKKHMLAAISKDAIATSVIYTYPDAAKELRNLDWIGSYSAPKHLRRLILFNLLNNLGFTKETRKKIDGADIPDPDPTCMQVNNARSLLNQHYWENYVASLNGVPPLEKDSRTLGSIIQNSLTKPLQDIGSDARDLMNTFNELKSWGDGKKGAILFGANDKTYEIENQAFKEVEGLEPNLTYLSKDTVGLTDKQKKKLERFVEKLRKTIIDSQF